MKDFSLSHQSLVARFRRWAAGPAPYLAMVGASIAAAASLVTENLPLMVGA